VHRLKSSEHVQALVSFLLCLLLLREGRKQLDEEREEKGMSQIS